MKITDEQYRVAKESKNKADEIINEYHKERVQETDAKLKSGHAFKDEELHYSATSLCPCGHGLAYAKLTGMRGYWDCSAILKGIADKNVQHTGQLPFALYDVKGESEHRGTTRGVFKPKTTDTSAGAVKDE